MDGAMLGGAPPIRRLPCSRALLALQALPAICVGWNSAATLDRLYSFQEFYTDAQYGPDFGYYSTGRILHADGPIENGVEGDTGSQEWFNSYTTLPMSLSPYFGSLVCDRLAGMWSAMGEAGPVFIVEFGGGTGMLARDLLRHCRQAYPDFYAAVARYVIGERSQALRSAQLRTAAEFHRSGKLLVAEADARQASQLRDFLTQELGGQGPIRGFILSNELLDEFDPLRMRLMWRTSQPPDAAGCESCSSYREAHVLHRVDDSALVALLHKSGSAPGEAEKLAAAFRWEGKVLACGLLEGPLLQRLLSEVSEGLGPDERRACSPMQVCCNAFSLALDTVLQIDHPSLQHVRPHRWESLVTEVQRRYRLELSRTNGTIPLSKERYRELRRLASRLGPEVEKSLLVGGSALPGRIHSDEVYLGLSPARCQELRGWRERNAERLAAAAALREKVAPLYDRSGAPMGAEHLKLVVRPGEAEFVHQASLLLDDGYLVTMDYGADAEALTWQSLAHPNFEGIHTMDARAELADDCTHPEGQAYYLQCPGLQDITTTIDFTEVAEAGRRLGGWEVAGYGPLFLLELAFGDQTRPDPIPHLIERAGGARTVGLHSWYRKAEGDPWGSFKVLVQRRGAAGSWTLGPPGLSWPLEAFSRLSRPPSPCWSLDLSKPPLAAAVTREAVLELRTLGGLGDQEATQEETKILTKAFASVLQRGVALDKEHTIQKQSYREMHLALMLADYWLHLARGAGPVRCARPPPYEREAWAAEARSLASLRRLPELHGEAMFDQVFAALQESAFGNSTVPGPGAEPFVCAAAELVRHVCATAPVETVEV